MPDDASPDKEPITPPPIKPLPVPDQFDSRNIKDGRSNVMRKSKDKGKGKKKKKRSHPTDIYKESRSFKGSGCGCAGCLPLILVLLIVLLGCLFYTGKPFIAAGYKFQHIKEPDFTITETPSSPMIYFSMDKITIDLQNCPELIGVIAPQIVASGSYKAAITLRGGNIKLSEGTAFQKDLDVMAIHFEDNGATVTGVFSGKTLK